jgi:hypothetical protein
MRFQHVSAISAGEYGASGYGARVPEQVFGVFRNGHTAALSQGQPAVLATATASANGYDVVAASAAGSDVNNLFVGLVAQDSWAAGDWGLVQVYGLHGAAVVAVGTATQAAGLILRPDAGGKLATVAPYFATGTAGTDANAAPGGVAGLCVLMQTLATSSAAGTTTAKVFIRAL